MGQEYLAIAVDAVIAASLAEGQTSPAVIYNTLMKISLGISGADAEWVKNRITRQLSVTSQRDGNIDVQESLRRELDRQSDSRDEDTGPQEVS